MYCPKCGKQMPRGSEFCPHDGAKLPQMRVYPGREKPEMPAPGKLPYYRDLPPKYEPGKTENQTKKPSTGALIMIWIFICIIIFIIASAAQNSGGGGNKSSCPITPTCGDRGLGSIIPPGCTCPSACNKYFIIHNPPSMEGWKQCHP